MKYINNNLKDHQIYTIKYIVEFYKNNKSSLESYQSRTLPFLRSISSISKELHFNKTDIIKKVLSLDSSKIDTKTFTNIINYYKNKNTVQNIINTLNVNVLINDDYYVYLPRGYLNDGKTKGHSTLLPILNFYDRSKLDFSTPINLTFTEGEEFRIYDYYYFKIFASSIGGGTHRTAGIVTSLGLLRDCQIDNKVIYYQKYYTKTSIDALSTLINKISNNTYIGSIYEDKQNYKYVIQYENFTINVLEFNDLYNLLLNGNFEVIFNFMKDNNISLINYTLENKFKVLSFVINGFTLNFSSNESTKFKTNQYCIIYLLNKIIYFYNKFFNIIDTKLSSTQVFKHLNQNDYLKIPFIHYKHFNKLQDISKVILLQRLDTLENEKKATLKKISFFTISTLSVITTIIYFYLNPEQLYQMIIYICNYIIDYIEDKNLYLNHVKSLSL